MNAPPRRLALPRDVLTAAPRLAGVLGICALAVVSAACGGTRIGSENRPDGREERPPEYAGAAKGSQLESDYDRAVAQMTSINHLLEERQAELSFARRDGAPAAVIADLRDEVASLERRYADSIEAMIAAVDSDQASASPAPSMRNRGYRVEHYLLQLAVEPKAKRVRVHATITARSTRPLRSLLFRFAGLDPHHLDVQYQPARYHRSGPILRITPRRPIDDGRTFIVTAAYEGAVSEILSGRVWTGKSGWYPTDPSPSSRARYSLRVSVPEPLLVTGTGRLAEMSRVGRTRTFAWEIEYPITTEQVALAIGGQAPRHVGHNEGLPSP